MGCWNETCFITNLPIVEGDKIYAFPIKKKSYTRGGEATYCYSTDEYAPSAFPVIGTYNDYGAIEKIHDHTDAEILEWNKKLLSIPGNIDIEDHLKDQVRRGKIEGQSLLFAHYDIVNNLVKKHMSIKDYYYDIGRTTFDKFLAHEKEKIIEAQKELELAKLLNIEPYFNEYRHTNKLRSTAMFHSLEGEMNFYHTMIIDLLLDANNIEHFQFVYTVDCILSESRKRWAIPSGTGSQHKGYETILNIAREAIEHTKRTYHAELEYEGFNEAAETLNGDESLEEERKNIQSHYGLLDHEL